MGFTPFVAGLEPGRKLTLPGLVELGLKAKK